MLFIPLARVSQGSFWFSVTHHPAETPAPQSFLKLPEKVLVSPLIIRFNISHVRRPHQLIRIVLRCTNIPLYYCGTELHFSRWCVETLRVGGQSDLTKAPILSLYDYDHACTVTWNNVMVPNIALESRYFGSEKTSKIQDWERCFGFSTITKPLHLLHLEDIFLMFCRVGPRGPH